MSKCRHSRQYSFEEYWERSSKSGYYPDTGFRVPQKNLSRTFKERRYEKYLRKHFQKTERLETARSEQLHRDTLLKEAVAHRDGNRCRFWSVLSPEEKEVLGIQTVAPQDLEYAHVFRRSGYSRYKFCPSNVVQLHKVVHFRLDNYKDPLTGNPCSAESVNDWWARILGTTRKHFDQYQNLL